MSSFWNLVLNENMKIYRRSLTWTFLSILAIFSLLLPVLFRQGMGSTGISIWESASTTVGIVFVFLNSIFCVVITTEVVAGEFTWGTIKLLLIRPWSRSKILASKYVAVIGFSLLSTLLIIILATGMSYILFSQSVPYDQGDSVNTAGHVIASWGFSYVDLFITIAIAFMLAIVFRSGGLSIGISLFIIITRNPLSLIFNPNRYEWTKYVLFTNMDLGKYMDSATGSGLITEANAGMTLGFSIAVLAVYYVIFMLISWVVFNKRDVAG